MCLAAGRFHLDDPRTLVGQHHRGVRPRQHLREVDDDQPVERADGLVHRIAHRCDQWLLRLSSTVRSASTHSLSSWFTP